MKKVLFATTALVATAGVAAADGHVVISGAAEMGISGGSDAEVNFFQDVDATLTFSGETDNGLSFGFSIDLDEVDDDKDLVLDETVGGSDFNGDGDSTDTAVRVNVDEGSSAFDPFDDGGVVVFISGDFGTLSMGDTDGALDLVMQEAATANDPGSLADDHTSHAGYLGSYGDGAGGGDGQILTYSYSFGDFLFAVSYEQDANGAYGEVVAGHDDGGWAVGMRYSTSLSMADLTFGVGYQTTDFGTGSDQGIIGVSMLAVIDAFAFAIQYSDWSDVAGVAGDDDAHIGIGIGYTYGDFTAHMNYGEFDSGASGFGVALGYSLGGGANILFGYGSSDPATAADFDTWSLGVSMSF